MIARMICQKRVQMLFLGLMLIGLGSIAASAQHHESRKRQIRRDVHHRQTYYPLVVRTPVYYGNNGYYGGGSYGNSGYYGRETYYPQRRRSPVGNIFRVILGGRGRSSSHHVRLHR